MKKRLASRTLIAIAVLVVVLTPALKAGDYHTGDTLYCQECHVMHYSQAHVYVTGETLAPMVGGPNPYLLRQEGSAVCLACHDGAVAVASSIPDVKGDDGNTTGAGGRQGGAITVSPTDATYPDADGHTLVDSGTVPVPGGSDLTAGFNCYDCHAAHGNAYYRNVLTSVSYENNASASNTNDVRVGVALPAVGARISGGTYSRDNIFFNEPAATGDTSMYGAFCASCHGDFHGTANTGSASGSFVLHPTEGIDFSTSVQTQFALATAHTERLQVMVPSNSATITDFSDATPSCMSCHKAHGSTNPFGLIYADGSAVGATGDYDGDGDGDDVNDMCRRCHNK
jgi:hypothetical protein